ncbi:hypothetical protein E4U32_007473 [Claviceps aff. humidiphila group G2b]|nr:hypothetical protein E4U32_007473 [Claviceps aff. humidiphila group G2b]
MEASASLSEEIPKYTSKPCVLVVGEAGEKAFLHSYHVKRASGALGKLVDTSFAEGQNGYVVLRDVDAETILAFAQFIYAGNYYISFDMSTTATESGNESNKTDNTEDDFNNGDMEQNYSELFISQAKIFVFAEYYGISAFEREDRLIEDVLALIRYCYDRPGIEKLKEMVAAYSAAIIDAQVSDVVAECFRDVLRERGDFAADIACHLVSSL